MKERDEQKDGQMITKKERKKERERLKQIKETKR